MSKWVAVVATAFLAPALSGCVAAALGAAAAVAGPKGVHDALGMDKVSPENMRRMTANSMRLNGVEVAENRVTIAGEPDIGWSTSRWYAEVEGYGLHHCTSDGDYEAAYCTAVASVPETQSP